MNCERVRGELAAYSAGLIRGEARGRLAEHLAACAACRAELGEYRALDALIAGERATAGEDLVGRTMREVRVIGAPERPSWLWAAEQAAPLAIIAAVIPLMALLILSAIDGPLAAEVATLLEGVAHGPEIATGLTLSLCGLASLAAAWTTWRAANSLA